MSRMASIQSIADLLEADFDSLKDPKLRNQVQEVVLNPFMEKIKSRLEAEGIKLEYDIKPLKNRYKELKTRPNYAVRHENWADGLLHFWILVREQREHAAFKDAVTWGLYYYNKTGKDPFFDDEQWNELSKHFEAIAEQPRWIAEGLEKYEHERIKYSYRMARASDARRLGDQGLAEKIARDLVRWTSYAKDDEHFKAIRAMWPDNEDNNGQEDDDGQEDNNGQEGPGKPEALDSVKSLRTHLAENPCVVLQGPPGTGKTYLAEQIIRDTCGADNVLARCHWSELVEDARKEQGENWRAVLEHLKEEDLPCIWEIVQLHPGYAYEDFVRGIAAETGKQDAEGLGLSFASVDRVMVQLAEAARQMGPKRPVILVLDEINRCNLASVLGELILVLEKSKRMVATREDPNTWDESSGTAVRLQYPPPKGSGTGWTLKLPSNLWIIGTMNTADRSIALVDYAIRRRFRFIDVLPDPKAITSFYARDEIAEGREQRGQAARALFEEAARALPELPERLRVGHSYFMEPALSGDEPGDWEARLARRFVYEVVPLLREYHAEGMLDAQSISIAGASLRLGSPSQAEAEQAKPEQWVQGIASHLVSRAEQRASATPEGASS